MSGLAEIRAAIAKLSPEEYCELMAELHPFEDDEWDLQMKADAAAGKFDAMNARAEADLRAGRCIPLERMFEQEEASSSGSTTMNCLEACVSWRERITASGKTSLFTRR